MASYRFTRNGPTQTAAVMLLLMLAVFGEICLGRPVDTFAASDPNLASRIEALEQELARVKAAQQQFPLRAEEAAFHSSGHDISLEHEPWTSRNDWQPTVNLGGFFQADWGFFHQDEANILTVEDVQDGADFRRARLNAHGDVWHNIGYMVEFDFAFPGRPSFMDVYFDIRDTPAGTFRMGQWRHPIGMDALTSVKELTFLERALPFAFLPFRQIGLGFFDHSVDETLTWAVSGFRYPTDAFGGNVGDNGGYGLAARITRSPWISEDDSRLLHLGAAYSFGDPANDLVRYRNQPEFFVSETGGADLVPTGVPSNVPPFVDTGSIAANYFHVFAAEGGLVLGSLYMQSEAVYAAVDRPDSPAVHFSGAYAYAGYFLTGEVRSYNRKSGVFARVEPLNNFGPCGWGAWEVAARWSYIDLNDADIAGRRMNNVTFGINWYLQRQAKFQFNYIHAFLDDPAIGDSNADIFALRGQVDF